eukprot:4175807-Amphidinium_carterae.1
MWSDTVQWQASGLKSIISNATQPCNITLHTHSAPDNCRRIPTTSALSFHFESGRVVPTVTSFHGAGGERKPSLRKAL